MKILIKSNFILIFILLLFNGRGSSNNVFVFNLDVGFAYVLVLILQIVSLFMLWTYRKIRIDKITILLSIQILLYTLSLLIFPDSIDSMKYYVAALISLGTYMFFLNSSVNIMNKKMLLLSEMAIIIISLQMVSLTIRAITSNIPYYLMKNYIQTPTGGSNYVGSFLLMFLVLVINLEEKKIRKFIFILLGILGVVLTRSNGAMVLLVMIFIFEYGRRCLSSRNLRDSIKYGILIILSGFILWKTFELFPGYFERFTLSFQRFFFGGSEGIVASSNNRVDLYSKSLREIAKNPIIGHGLNYRNYILDMSAHNLILDQLLKAGLFSAIVFLAYISTLLYNFSKYRKSNKEIKTLSKMVVVVMINGMFEQNLGGLNFDFFFWLFCGVGMANVNYIKELKYRT
ncbi:O-antigen ligase family protein [Brassicibacter mesophilus]|uniref:O-antigen ligase family protein n=1 Tax=Brassicibacter mesophilus TaxID=745119 RepID=UPI003D1E4257